MDRGTLRRVGVAGIAAGALLAVTGQARAQEPPPPWHFDETIEYTRTQAGQQIGVLYMNGLSGDHTGKTVSGTIDGAVFAGTAYEHTYARQGDTGSYRLSGWADPTGAAPAEFLSGTLSFTRAAGTMTFTFQGTLAGQPVEYTSPPVPIPVYGIVAIPLT